MATYWKEVVNFGGEFGDIKLLLSVCDGKGVFTLDTAGHIENGSVQLLVKEEGFSHDFVGGKCEFSFETNHRDYCVRLYRGEKLICWGGNSKNLRHEFALPKILATDTFEERVADFNYYETELGEKGKNLENLLGENNIVEKEEIKAEIAKEIKEEPKEEIKEETETKEEIENMIENKELKEETVTTKSETAKTAKAKPQNQRKTGSGKQASQAGRKPQSSSKKSPKEEDFFSLAKPQVEKMLAKFPKEEFLEDVLDNSRWVKVDFSKDVSYAVGIIYADDLVGYIGYGAKGKLSNPPKFENPQFVPFDIANPNGEGYFLVFQRADTGEKV